MKYFASLYLDAACAILLIVHHVIAEMYKILLVYIIVIIFICFFPFYWGMGGVQLFS